MLGALALAFALAAPVAGCVGPPWPASRVSEAPVGPVATAVRNELLARDPADQDVVAFYRARSWRPLWVKGRTLKPETRQLQQAIAGGQDDDLDPQAYRPVELAAMIHGARRGEPAALARADVALSRAFADYASDLRSPPPGAAILYTDPAIRPPAATRRAVLDEAGQAPRLGQHLAALRRMNPVYDELRTALGTYRADWSSLPRVRVAAGPTLNLGDIGPRVAALRRRLGVLAPAAGGPARYDAALQAQVRRFQAAHGLPADGRADAATLAALNAGPARYEQRLRLNLARARALPLDMGKRFVLVNAAAQRLWLYEDGRVRDSMAVVVGKPSEPTPVMAGVIRYAVLRPYWNVPVDLVQKSLAPKVARSGLAAFTDQNMEALSDWSDRPRVLDPTRINWPDVAAGRQELRVRQRPGPQNMMGAVKFMFPNTLGVYLHDTPNKALFAEPQRTFSAGCVRLEDAPRLARWLLGERGPAQVADAQGPPETRVDLRRPVPVYIVYFTAASEGAELAWRPDVYGRDQALIAQLDPPHAPAAAGGAIIRTAR